MSDSEEIEIPAEEVIKEAPRKKYRPLTEEEKDARRKILEKAREKAKEISLKKKMAGQQKGQIGRAHV